MIFNINEYDIVHYKLIAEIFQHKCTILFFTPAYIFFLRVTKFHQKLQKWVPFRFSSNQGQMKVEMTRDVFQQVLCWSIFNNVIKLVLQ